MISSAAALKIILDHARSYGTDVVTIEDANDRVLAEDIRADRDAPPFNRATMDGIAIRFSEYAAGGRKFDVLAVQAAGTAPLKQAPKGSCIQIMTGAAVPDMTDTVVPIEDVMITNNIATISTEKVTHGQFIHFKGKDKPAGEIIITAGQILTPVSIPIAASVGLAKITVNRPPRILIITTGDELVNIDSVPSAFQIRRSNDYALVAALNQYATPADMIHLSDDPANMQSVLKHCLKAYDAIIISGGVSKGKFDFVPKILAELSVETHFHGVKQKPGKPFLFGSHPGGAVVFALPGNPVSTFLCFFKYVLPWLQSCLGEALVPVKYAMLERDIHFLPKLDYFLQVSLHSRKDGMLIAAPINNNGSGDFMSLLAADAFLELPANKAAFKKGEAYPMVSLGRIL